MKTELKDRVLWFDGTVEVTPDRVPELLLHGVDPNQIIVTELVQDIKDFNLLSDDEEIRVGKEVNEKINMGWNVPLNYQQMDLDDFILQKAAKMGDVYVSRSKEELQEIRSRGFGMIFKTLIYIVDQLRLQKKVWGVGRGSSCASLVLHIIGIHEVDPVKFGIPASEFFHD